METKTPKQVVMQGVVCFLLTSDGRVWLAKKVKKVGAGLRNGYGGKIKLGETPRTCVQREVLEESSIDIPIENFIFSGTVTLTTEELDGSQTIWKLWAYRAITDKKPAPSTEMADPQPYRYGALPLEEMLPADSWVSLIFVLKEHEQLLVSARYGPGQKELLGNVTVSRVSNLDE